MPKSCFAAGLTTMRDLERLRAWERARRKTEKYKVAQRHWCDRNRERRKQSSQRWRESSAGRAWLALTAKARRASDRARYATGRYRIRAEAYRRSEAGASKARRRAVLWWLNRQFSGNVPDAVRSMALAALTIREELRAQGLISRNGRPIP